ncbi:hypothetical protein V6N12_024318 [Hibiscus sabdariffa]|uniref:Endonuclease/exonuclease/phosphatase domain-containing protein n=1 Tax=Hibiscus sabdariffa TaxID=183260 RepID=A0ABR2G075_9ROSI
MLIQEGLQGGLALWWDSDTAIDILYADKNVIEARISINGGQIWLCSFIYEPLNREAKKNFWQMMTSRKKDSEVPWCVMGDSNIVIKQDEKLGGNLYDLEQAKWLSEFIDTGELIEMPLKGGFFTWSNRRSEDDAILEKLDRVLVNHAWLEQFNRAEGFLEPAIGSDHGPIIWNTLGTYRRRKKDFKFEAK